MKSRASLNRRGVALPLTLIVLTALTLLAGMVLMLARLESRSADQALAATQATAPPRAESSSRPELAHRIMGYSAARSHGRFRRRSLEPPAADSITHLGALLYLQSGFAQVNDAGGHPGASRGGAMDADRATRFPTAGDRGSRSAELGGMSVDGGDHVPPGWGGVCPLPLCRSCGD
jgi:hypothetical protein